MTGSASLVVPNDHFYLITAGNTLTQHGKNCKEIPSWGEMLQGHWSNMLIYSQTNGTLCKYSPSTTHFLQNVQKERHEEIPEITIFFIKLIFSNFSQNSNII